MDIVFTPKRTLCAAIIASVALLTAHLCYLHYAYPYITADDAFISLRYAQRLLDGKGLTWNDGEYVEGYSNLLWVLSCAALAAIKIRLTATPELLGVGCTFLVLPVFWWHAAQAKLTPWAVLAGAIAFAMAAPVAVWALAGMETPMVMLFFAWVTALVYPLMQRFDTKYAAASGLLLGLICLLRPEGPVYTLSVASSLLVFSAVPIPRRIAMLTVLCGIPMVFFLSQLAFRLSYYGQWVSNTVMAKVAFTAGRLQTGFVYATDAIYFLLPMLLYTAINLWGVVASACR
jgi:arabinofuranosyltransferase